MSAAQVQREQGKLYTVIYNDGSLNRSVGSALTKLRRLEVKMGETLKMTMERAGILESAVFVFEGHPSLKGQRDDSAQKESHVLVTVRGGIAETYESGPVKVTVFDFDNSADVDAGVGEEFADLAKRAGVRMVK
jgi:hypothetical protein